MTGALMAAVAAAPGADPPPRAQDVLAAAGIAVPGAVIVDRSRSHSVVRVELPDGSAFMVKSVSATAQRAGRSLVAELYLYRLAGWVPGLDALVPRAVHLDERRQLVAVVASPDEHLLTAHLADPSFPAPAVLAALGRTLARLHRATAEVPLPRLAAVGIVHLPTTPAEQWFVEAPTPAVRTVGESITSDVALAGALHRCATVLTPSCLIHADLKWDNLAVAPGPRITLFDWELSGRGDPAWDLGSALADTTAHPLRRGQEPALPTMGAGQAALLRAYAEEQAERPVPGGPPAPAADLASRVLLCWIARLAHLALECAGEPGAGPGVDSLLRAARRLCASEDALRADVAAALEVR